MEIAYRHRKGRDDFAESVAKLLNIVNVDCRGDRSFEEHYQRTYNCCFQKKITRFTYTSFQRYDVNFVLLSFLKLIFLPIWFVICVHNAIESRV